MYSQILRSATVMDNSPPSNILMGSVEMLEDQFTKDLETISAMFRNQVLQLVQLESDLADFIKRVESRGQPQASEKFDVCSAMMVQIRKKVDTVATVIEKVLVEAKNRLEANEDGAAGARGLGIS
ncbi:hypothetical protein UCDDA912_g01552 [Diaporthe ampelina]|uniref:Uncharacterized protein n=1 Tax=Diaporthe ampelina TaxID=1214573 RepID=A0A0G2IER3_9PEZI|nr:hypothetical protein UCDDA912_g01552 [Diaporthe ampelina]